MTAVLLSGFAGCVKPYEGATIEDPPLVCQRCDCTGCGCEPPDCVCFGCHSPRPACPETLLEDRVSFSEVSSCPPPPPAPLIGEFLALPVAPCEDACGRVPLAVGGDRMVFVVAAHRLYRSTHGMPFEELALPALAFPTPARTSQESVHVVAERLVVWTALARDTATGIDLGVLVAVTEDWGATWKNVRVLGPHPGARAIALAGGSDGAMLVAVSDAAGVWARWLYDDGATIGLPELVRAAPAGEIEIGEPVRLTDGGAIIPMLEPASLRGEGGARLAVGALGEWRVEDMPPGAATPPDLVERFPGALSAAWLDAGGGVRVARFEGGAWSGPEHWGDARGAPAIVSNGVGGLDVAWVEGTDPTELAFRRVANGGDGRVTVATWQANAASIVAPPLVSFAGQAALGWIGMDGEETMVMAAVEHHARPRAQAYVA